MKFDTLMAISEAAQGFSGGAPVDKLPYLSLSEATTMFPAIIAEEQVSLYESTMSQNESLVEAAISGGDVNALVEGAWETIKTKIAAFFEKMKKWISSIIAKLKLEVDKLRMKGKQLYSKYKDHPNLKQDFKGLTVTGYKFAKSYNVGSFDFGGIDKIRALHSDFGPIDFPKSATMTDADHETAKEKLDAAKAVSVDEVKQAVAKRAIGIDDEDWKAELRKQLYGEDGKVELKCDEDFTYDSVVEAIKNGSGWDAVEKEYDAIDKAIKAGEKQFKDSYASISKDFEKEIKSNNNSTEPGNNAPNSYGKTIANDYYNFLLNVYQSVYGALADISAIHKSYANDKYNQNTVIFGKMLSYKKKKSENSSADFDAFDEFDVEL